MISLSDTALEKLADLVAKSPDGVGIRLGIAGRGPNDFIYDMRIVDEDEVAEAGEPVEFPGLTVYLASESASDIKGATIDFHAASGFRIDNPNPMWADAVALQVQEVITQHINPGVAQHGGAVVLLEVKDDVAYIQLSGGCVGCGMADVTLKQGVEVMITQAVPQIARVVDTTDHASGTNPYYQNAKGGGPHYQPAKGGEAPRSPLS